MDIRRAVVAAEWQVKSSVLLGAGRGISKSVRWLAPAFGTAALVLLLLERRESPPDREGHYH